MEGADHGLKCPKSQEDAVSETVQVALRRFLGR